MTVKNERIDIRTPVGRLIQGDPFEGQTTDAKGNPLTVKNGPNRGQPRVEYFVGIAIRKDDPGYPAFWATIHEKARADFPTLFDASGNCINPEFAWKVTDGDSQETNKRGIRPCDRDGWPGHWILGFSTGFPPKVCDEKNHPITDSTELKKGYFIEIAGTCAGNGDYENPGMFLNHTHIRRVAYGDEIITGKSADEAFGGAYTGPVPEGGSLTPTAPPAQMPGTGTPPPGSTYQPPNSAAPGTTPGTPAPPPGSAYQPPAGPPPNTGNPPPAGPDFLNNAPGGPPAAPGATSGGEKVLKYKTADGRLWTSDQLRAANWDTHAIESLPHEFVDA